MVGCDHIVIPLAPDLYSMQGLRNMGPKIRQWRKDWEIRKLMAKHGRLEIALPSGGMNPIGYVAIKFSIMKQKPTRAFQHWIDAMPAEYRTSISADGSPPYPDVETDEFCLAQIKDYKSLIPASQARMKPIFQLGQTEGVWGQNATAVEQCGQD